MVIDIGTKRAHYDTDRNASSKRPGLPFNLLIGIHPDSVASLRTMSGERKHHAITQNLGRRVGYPTAAGGLCRRARDGVDRLRLGWMDVGKHVEANNGE